MRFWDYHTHNQLCKHAFGTLEEYVQSGIEKNLLEIGLTDHFPMFLLPEPFHPYSMEYDELPGYLNECRRLKKIYNKDILVKIGLEVDFYPGTLKDYRKLLNPILSDLDYIIGSVHAIKLDDGRDIPIDTDLVKPIVKEYGYELVFKKYYDYLYEMIKLNDIYDIVGHFDILVKSIGKVVITDSIESLIFKIIDLVKKQDMVIEINTSGLRRKEKEQYPSDFILKNIIEQEIPLTLGSDAHDPKDVGYGFGDIYKQLKKKYGTFYLSKFTDRNRIDIKI